MENLAALLEMTVMEQLEKCCLHSVGAHDAVGSVEGMDVMSAIGQALPLHNLQCSNGEEANRFRLGVYYNDARGAAMYPVSTTRELDAVRAVVCCARSSSPKRITYTT